LPGRIRVLVADDHAVVRRGLSTFLGLQPDLAVVGEAADGAEAVERAVAEGADVVVMDLAMPRVDGIEATRLVREARPEAKVLVLSSFSDDERVLPALQAGADGYLTKDASPEELAESIRLVRRGEPVFSPRVVQRVIRLLSTADTRPEGTVTIVFTDIEGSTRIVETLGDEPAHRVFAEHDSLVRDVVARHGGVEVEHQGDAFMLAFSSARRAVRSAIEIQRELAERANLRPEPAVKVRIGLNTGDVIAQEDRYFGRAIFVASRVASQACGGEILVSDLTKALVDGSSEFGFSDRGERELKGLTGRHRLHEVQWA
jgi:DNA-binding NarL/FixJ family response regulator